METPNVYPDAGEESYVPGKTNEVEDAWLDDQSGLLYLFTDTTTTFVFDFEGSDEDVQELVSEITLNESEMNISVSYDSSLDQELTHREMRVSFAGENGEELKEIIEKFGGRNLRIEKISEQVSADNCGDSPWGAIPHSDTILMKRIAIVFFILLVFVSFVLGFVSSFCPDENFALMVSSLGLLFGLSGLAFIFLGLEV